MIVQTLRRVAEEVGGEAAEHAAEANAARLVLPETDELIFGTIAFLILFVVVAYLAFPALRRALKEREDGIRGEMERAERARVDAEDLREQYNRQLTEARTQAEQIIKEAQATAEDVRRDILARAEEEGRQIVEKARTDATQERDRVLSQMRSEVADLSLQLAARVVEKELSDPEAQRQLVDQFISQTSNLGSQN